MQDNQTYDVFEGTVTIPTTTQNKYYTIMLIDDSSVHNVAPSNLYDEKDVPSADKPSASSDYIVSTHPHTLFTLIMECQVIQQAIYINIIKNQPWPQHIENSLEIPFDNSLGRASLTCHLPLNKIPMAIAGSSHQLSISHQRFVLMNRRRSTNHQRSNTNNNNNNTNNQQGNFQYQRGDQNNGNNENGNRNNRDNRNNDDHRPPTTNNRNDGPIGGTMTETRKAKLKEKGFLVAQGRYITFVHKFSGYNNKGKCKYFVYKGGACNKTDSGTCKFSHTNSFRSLPAQDKYALKAWVRNTPGVPFVDGRGPTNSSKYIITT